ncbi:FIVAR domain-containing protein [Anaerococcus sp. Marseille-P9784]|uniref:FIVAR domain-containing protein n=1 Tax=Anaerococcus sp. Marseille-P9784 TaxID=2614127 RepID=UPI00124A8ED3|nr:FIVAR domain-containing protein [Anaerococcus sp. Marseille-P9784]
MNKKVLALGLSMAFVLSIGNNAYAKENKNNVALTSQQKEETHKYIYEVIKIKDKEITLLYQGEKKDDEMIIVELDKDTNLTLEKSFFEDDLAIHDQYEITSKKTLSDLDGKEIKKEDLKLVKKYEKPTNMDISKLPANTEKMDFIAKEVKGDKESGFSVIIAEIANDKNLYSLSSDNLRDENVKVGDKYRIYWDGITLESYPAQFGTIYRVEKLDKEENEEKTTLEFEISEIDKENKVATIFEVGNKSNLFSIEVKDLKDDSAKIGNRYKITWDGTATKSIPAQFGKIFEVTKTFDSVKENIVTREFELVDITESKDGKDANLKDIKATGNIYLLSLDELKDKYPKIGDRYLITFNDVYDKTFDDIKKIEKWIKKESNTNLEELNKAIEKADNILIGDGSYTKKSVERFQNAFENAKALVKKSNLSQEEVDKATKELNDSISGLKEKSGVITREFVLSEIFDKSGKKARLRDIEYKDKEFTTNFESLGDKNAKVGDHFMVTIGKVDPDEVPYQMGQITKIEKKVIKKEVKNKKAKKLIGFGNPKTGIFPVAPLVLVIAGAGLALKKKK